MNESGCYIVFNEKTKQGKYNRYLKEIIVTQQILKNYNSSCPIFIDHFKSKKKILDFNLQLEHCQFCTSYNDLGLKKMC